MFRILFFRFLFYISILFFLVLLYIYNIVIRCLCFDFNFDFNFVRFLICIYDTVFNIGFIQTFNNKKKKKRKYDHNMKLVSKSVS